VRAQRSTVLLRWCMVGVAALVGVLYYHPLTSYAETRSLLNERSGEVAELRAEKARLEARLERSGTLAALSREARQMNLVRPGERLYIVKGIPEWRRAQRTMRGDG
jgi:Septum formation initiator